MAVSYTHLDVYKRQPIVGMGLLLDANQIPIGMKLYPGNESEKPIIRNIIAVSYTHLVNKIPPRKMVAINPIANNCIVLNLIFLSDEYSIALVSNTMLM